MTEHHFMTDSEHGKVLVFNLMPEVNISLWSNGKQIDGVELSQLILEGNEPLLQLFSSQALSRESIETISKRCQRLLKHVELIFSPDMVVMNTGGHSLFQQTLEKLDLPLRYELRVV